MKYLVILAVLAVPVAASAQETVLMPKALMDATIEWVRHPNVGSSVDLWLSLNACMSANTATTAGNCPAVTAAIKAGHETK